MRNMGKPGESRYGNGEYYCGNCGVWIKAVEVFLGRGGAVRHRACGCRVRYKPRVNPPDQRKYVELRV